MNLDDIIEYEPEQTRIDFKKNQYWEDAEGKLKFLKDVLAMANADCDDPRHIICGVKKLPSGSYTLHSIAEAEFEDASNLQELVRENIEPQLAIEYSPHRFQGQLLGILTIDACKEQPYAMRKSYGKLRRGEMWIRKGTSQALCIRSDLERMYLGRDRVDADAVQTIWANGGKELVLETLSESYCCPSRQQIKAITAILEERQSVTPDRASDIQILEILNRISNPFEPRRLETMNTEELEAELIRYEREMPDEWDLYDLFEVHAHQIQVSVLNNSGRFLEDVRVDLEFPSSETMAISPEVYQEPRNGLLSVGSVRIPSFGYPEVCVEESVIKVTSMVGDIRHGVVTNVFDEPLRIIAHAPERGTQHSVTCVLHVRNLPIPIKQDLILRWE